MDGLDDNVLAFRINGGVNGETSDGIFVIFNPNNAATSVTLPDGAWDVCVDADHAGTEALTTVSGSVSVEPISAMVLVKKALKQGYKEGIYSEIANDVVRPSAEECAQNGRARSTKMRWAVRAE